MLSIALYGCECWSLPEALLERLRVFHAQCLRAMCRVTRMHTWRWHITTHELGQRMGLDSIDVYIARRQLRWLGHVRRMDFERLPRRMLSSWVPEPRPCGAPKMTYGRTIYKALDMFSIAHEAWPQLAADRAAWRTTLRQGFPPRSPSAACGRRRCRRPSRSRGRGAHPPRPPTTPPPTTTRARSTTTTTSSREMS